jgi:hypothetical protein
MAMSQDNNSFREFNHEPEKQPEKADNLFNRIMEPSAQLEAGSKALGQGLKGFPHVDLTGFEQEATYKSQGTFSDAWHSVKHLFVKDETLGEKLHEKVEKGMTPEEHKRYEQENKQLEEYNRKVVAWGVQATINPGPMPEAPNLPMHKEVDRRVAALEKEIADGVRRDMSPEDRRRLDKQFKTWGDELEDSQKIHNPLGTGEGFRPRPQPGNAVKDYFDRVKEATEKYLGDS